jgi:hypothetical protein
VLRMLRVSRPVTTLHALRLKLILLGLHSRLVPFLARDSLSKLPTLAAISVKTTSISPCPVAASVSTMRVPMSGERLPMAGASNMVVSLLALSAMRSLRS